MLFFKNKQYKINKRRREKFKWDIPDLVSLKHIHPRFGRRNQHLSLTTLFGKLSWVLQAKPPEASSSISDNRGMTYKRTADHMLDGIHKRIWTPDVPSCHCIKVQVSHKSCVLDARHRQVYQVSYSISYGLNTYMWATDSCPNGAEMLFQDEEEGEELKTRRSFILQQLVPVWQASERKSELLTAMSC